MFSRNLFIAAVLSFALISPDSLAIAGDEATGQQASPQQNASKASSGAFDEGMRQYRAENYEEALELLEKAYAENPYDHRVSNSLGMLHRELQNYNEAIRYYKECLSLSPENSRSRLVLADLLNITGSYDEALASADQAISAGAPQAEASLLKGRILLNLNRNREAVAALEKAKELNPELASQADFQIASVYYQQREYDKAAGIFRGLATTDPSSDWALLAKDYIKAIESAKPEKRLVAGIGVQFDDNAIAVPIDSSVVNIDKQEDWKRLFYILGEYAFDTKGRWTTRAAYSFNLAQFGQSDYDMIGGGQIFSQDTMSHSFSLLPSYTDGNGTLSFLINYSYLGIDYHKYSETFSVTPSYTIKLNEKRFAKVFVKVKKNEQDASFNLEKFGNYPIAAEDRDAMNLSAGLECLRLIDNGRGIFNLRLEAEDNNSDGDNWDYRAVRASGGISLPVAAKAKGSLYAEIYHQEYSNTNSIYGIDRKDSVLTIQPSLEISFSKPLDLILSYTFIRDDSNIAVYEYEKNVYAATLEYEF